MIRLICELCGIGFERKKTQRFCGNTCSVRYSNKKRQENGWSPSSEHRKRTADSLRGRKGHTNNLGIKISPRECMSCPECGIVFEKTLKSTKKYCSRVCAVKNMGGYREKSGRSKCGYYNGVYCASTYELAWVIYRFDHKQSVKRFEGFILYENDKKYYPDFIDGKKIFEIKGWVTTITESTIKAKCNAAILNGYEIEVLYKDMMKPIIKYVKDSRQVTNIECLYDDYKPTILYKCKSCNEEFIPKSRRPRKMVESGYVFCSISCSKKYINFIKMPTSSSG